MWVTGFGVPSSYALGPQGCLYSLVLALQGAPVVALAGRAARIDMYTINVNQTVPMSTKLFQRQKKYNKKTSIVLKSSGTRTQQGYAVSNQPKGYAATTLIEVILNDPWHL